MKQNWQYKKLGEVCEILNGFAFKSNLFKEEGLPILRISNIQDDIIDTEKLVYFNREDYNTDLNKFVVKPHDIVMALSGATTGKVGINKTEKEFYLNQRVALFKPKGIINLFLFNFLKTQITNVFETANGVAQPNISTGELQKLLIPVPPLSEQEQIVAELDLLSGIVEKQKQQLKELDTLSQSIFYSMFGDPITNDKNWEIIGFENCIEKIKYPNKLNTIDYLESGAFPIVSQEEVLISGFTDRKDCVFKLSKPIVVFGDHTRCLKYIPFDFALGADGVKILSPINKIDPRYFYYCLMLFHIPSLGYSRHFKLLKELNVPVPPLTLQNSFAEKIEKIEKQKEAINKSIEETQKLFDYTMDKYFG